MLRGGFATDCGFSSVGLDECLNEMIQYEHPKTLVGNRKLITWQTIRIEMSIRDWVREKEMLGGRFFTFEELRAAVPELSCQVVKNSLNRLRKSARIYSPYRGFYVILPPEYVRRGGVPPTFYMDDFMKGVHRSYYFSLLSAATFWGAAHQRPQVDFVTTDGRRLFAGARERRDVEWIVRPSIPEHLIMTKRGEAGDVRYSSAELTAVELVQYEHRIGGLSVAATVLSELLEACDFRHASENAFAVCKDAAIQRLGYVVEKVLRNELQGEIIYHEWVRTCKAPHFVPLSLRSSAEAKCRDERWKISVNTEIEVDDI